ncbi:unnamed protein product [Anisakis simplex]|uniref:Uncharacterized protein n=1 Tax=Anisakis simplex TaxID=6269 RepID=A0A0M3JA71_ANISI|nr:unnamed protein product [Anisakis simplex]
MAESSERSSNPKRSSDSSVRHKGTSKRSATKRRKVVAQRHFSADSEDERLKERLNAKFNVKQRKTVDDSAQGGSLGVCNSERHDAIIRRAECARINRLHKGAENNDAVPTRWKCALCQQRSSRSFLGDLYGPYFVRVQGNHWPSFLAKKPAHLNLEVPNSVWLLMNLSLKL